MNFAASLARPVVRGLLPLAYAHAAIAATIDAGMREGTLAGTGSIEERIHIDLHVLGLHIRNEQARRERASAAIAHVLRPLIDMHAPRNRLLAEAHNANEDAGRPLSEPEVAEAAAILVWRSMQGRRRHVG
jgi:hypothetical protein